jgi:hypothetical protein
MMLMANPAIPGAIGMPGAIRMPGAIGMPCKDKVRYKKDINKA